MSSTSSYEYANYLVDLLLNNKTTLGLKYVQYGDMQKIATVPSACVEPGIIRAEYNGTARRTMNQILTHIIVYHGQVQSTSLNQKDVDQLVNAIKILIHADVHMGGLCIDSYVSEIEPGYQTRGSSLFRATMLTVTARQQELLPQSF